MMGRQRKCAVNAREATALGYVVGCSPSARAQALARGGGGVRVTDSRGVCGWGIVLEADASLVKSAFGGGRCGWVPGASSWAQKPKSLRAMAMWRVGPCASITRCWFTAAVAIVMANMSIPKLWIMQMAIVRPTKETWVKATRPGINSRCSMEDTRVAHERWRRVRIPPAESVTPTRFEGQDAGLVRLGEALQKPDCHCGRAPQIPSDHRQGDGRRTAERGAPGT